MAQTVQKQIDPNKKYSFPTNISIVRYDSKIIVIAVDTGNWIVLENEKQLEFFNLLKENTLEKSLALFSGEQGDAVQTVIQLEARQFERQNVTSTESKKVMMYLTNGCNMRCPHCYMYAGCKKEDELRTDEIISFLSEIKKTGINKITFSGGEVCTRDDFSEIINRTYELGFEIEVLTNGTLWTDEMIESLSPKINKVQISVDGYSEEENARIRGKGNFEKSLSTVDKFIKHGVKTRIAITPWYDENLKNKIDDYANFANNLIEKYKGKPFEVNFSGEMIKGREINLEKEENEKRTEIIEQITAKTVPISRRIVFIERHKKFEILDNCSFGNLNVSYTGDIFACSRISEMKPFANLRKDGIAKVLKISDKAKKISNIDNLEPCNKCELKYICGGGCRLIHFKQIAQISDFDSEKVPPRICTQKEKESFYDLMIKSNKDIFQ